MSLLETPLSAAHRSLGARMVEFAGWSMPVLYRGILEEARAVRSASGIFDISHMGRVKVFGEGATDLLQKLTSNDVAALHPSYAHYSLLTNPTGGVIDDVIVYREGPESYLVVINAGNSEKDLNWIRSHTPASVTIQDQTRATAMIAVQGPRAPALVAKLAGDEALLGLGRFQYGTGLLASVPATFCRTGYTGEDGFELIFPAQDAEKTWNALLQAGAVACGLGARDALRIEAGYPLYGHEIDETSSPVEAGLMWVVKMEKGDFIGREAIASVQADGPAKRLMGLVSEERLQPRQGYTVYTGDDAIGVITSGVFSPTRGKSLAMGYIDSRHAKVGAEVFVAIRDKRISARITQKKSLLTS